MTTELETQTTAPTRPLTYSPVEPTPLPAIIEALRKIPALNDLADREYLWLAQHGTERFADAGAILFEEGEPARRMSIMLNGEVHVRRRHTQNGLWIGRSGQIGGLLPFSRMLTFGGQGYAISNVWALEFDKSLFDELLREIPSFGARVTGVLLDRVREVTRMEQQAEKLTALGKLAANLSHELNNPAAAAQRAASNLLEELRVYGREKYRLGNLRLAEEQISKVREWDQRIRSRTAFADTANDYHHGREEALQKWLDAQHVDHAWSLVPALAEAGVEPADLDELATLLDANALSITVSQFASSMRAQRMTEAVLHSTNRIFELIRAVKDYSYMDQTPLQEIDLPLAIQSTLAMLQSRVAKLDVSCDFEPGLPCITAFGSEVNQIWMALLENAIDAVEDRKVEEGRGSIRITASREQDHVAVVVCDNGPGIPTELRDRIFEPFFTTKAPGSGMGLGLDTVMRLVRKHRGYVTVESEPGNTCFKVRLPIQQSQAY